MGMKGVWAIPVIFGIALMLGLSQNAYAGEIGTIVWLNPADKIGKVALDGCDSESCYYIFRIPQDVESGYTPVVDDEVCVNIVSENDKLAFITKFQPCLI